MTKKCIAWGNKALAQQLNQCTSMFDITRHFRSLPKEQPVNVVFNANVIMEMGLKLALLSDEGFIKALRDTGSRHLVYTDDYEWPLSISHDAYKDGRLDDLETHGGNGWGRLLMKFREMIL